MGIYQDLGLKTYINACATITVMGGSVMPPEVVKAMEEASRNYVSIPDLQAAVGARLAELTHNEGAYISDGAASGLALAAAAFVGGTDPVRRELLPISETKNEIVINGLHKPGYDKELRMGGARLVYYGEAPCATEEQLEAAINENTCAIAVFYNDHHMGMEVPLERQVEIARAHNIPIIVDAAAQIPKKENLWRFTRDMGFDLAIFSGGKGLRGPQASGLIVGKKKWTDLIAGYACPALGVGRIMKVGKEEIVGLYTAVRLYMETDEEAVLADYEKQVRDVIDAFAGDEGVSVVRSFPSEAGQPMPRAQVSFCPCSYDLDVKTAVAELKELGILVAAGKDGLLINPQTLMPGEMKLVIEGVRKVADAHKR